ncbi:MAG: metallophosphoesterase [Lachnospiraceae bacterium]|uniref:Phosphoesterase n=1 Tax=Candidatus Weimeria bifida TaxID=2599074 RepID=A0A6N7IZK0_9FIRM|nr:metallophosphoesterase [Candidatus Weimeria bifida]RRF96564.1 MAG: metallophosphoesterase [Lachnospiraceae bacterium]
MRVLVVSDSHGRNENLNRVVLQVRPDLIYHLGDAQQSEDVLRTGLGVPLFYVRGNCDWGNEPLYRVTTLGNHRIFLTHGHRYGVDYSNADLIKAAEERDCDVAIYGHTHVPELTQYNGMTVLNPGSISLPRQPGRIPTYAVIDVDREGELHFTINELLP